MMIQCGEGTAEKGVSRNVLFLRYGVRASERRGPFLDRSRPFPGLETSTVKFSTSTYNYVQTREIEFQKP